MEEYLIYFHFRLMHHRIVPRLAIPASWWDWHLPEIGRNCSGWSSFQFCVVSNPMSLFPTKIVLPSCSVATCPSSIFSQNWKFPKFLYTPLNCATSIIYLQNFNFAQIHKILKNQTDLFAAFCKIWSPLMWGRYSWCDIKANIRHIEIWRMKTWKIDLLDFTFYAVFWWFCA